MPKVSKRWYYYRLSAALQFIGHKLLWRQEAPSVEQQALVSDDCRLLHCLGWASAAHAVIADDADRTRGVYHFCNPFGTEKLPLAQSANQKGGAKNNTVASVRIVSLLRIQKQPQLSSPKSQGVAFVASCLRASPLTLSETKWPAGALRAQLWTHSACLCRR